MSKWPSLLSYFCHVALAGYGVLVIALTIEFSLGKLVGSENRFLDYFFFGPTFLIPILLGLGLGFRFGKSLPALSSRLIFLIPLLLMAYELYVTVKYGLHTASVTKEIFDNFWGTNCSASECLGEAINTAPLVSSIAYAVGAEIGRFHHSAKVRAVS